MPSDAAPITPSPTHRLLEPATIRLHRLAPVLQGLRILHLTDLHIRRWRRRFRQLLEVVSRTEHDLLMLTGDYMDQPGDEPIAHEVLTRLLSVAAPRLGAFGVYGNHDTPEFRRRCEHLPVRWLNNQAWSAAQLPITVVGVDCGKHEHQAPRGDLLGALADVRRPADDPHREHRQVTILLAHMPGWLPAASQLGVDLVLSGHTHGGQMRFSPSTVLYNATPGWPLGHSNGVLQCGQTLSVISRGVGETLLGLRFLCPPHIPLLTLHQSPTPLTPTDETVCLARW